MMKYSGQKVLVLNCGGQVGFNFVRHFAKNGAKVIAVIRSQEESQYLKTLHEDISIIIESTNKKDWEESLTKFLPIRNIISMHLSYKKELDGGISSHASFIETCGERMIKHLYPLRIVCNDLEKHSLNGSIVLVSSTGLDRVGPNSLPLRYEKGGVESLCMTFSVRRGCKGIRCNNIQLGVFDPIVPDFLDKGTCMKNALIQRPVTYEDIYPVIEFLISDDSSMITGVSLPVDGGYLLK